MSKFSVGDKVIRTGGNRILSVGTISVVTNVFSNGDISVEEFPSKVFEENYFDLYEPTTTEEHTGGSSSYYDLKVGTTTVKCLDIIEGLNMSYNEGNVFKAVWRIAAAKQGKCKKGNNKYYDSEKIVFFGERLLQEHKA